jgi:hypothetical protein
LSGIILRCGGQAPLTAIAVTDEGLRVFAALRADYDLDYLGDDHVAQLFALLLP